MNILFLSLSKMADINTRGIYRDLIRHIAQNGHSITVAYPIEKREKTKIPRYLSMGLLHYSQLELAILQNAGIR